MRGGRAQMYCHPQDGEQGVLPTEAQEGTHSGPIRFYSQRSDGAKLSSSGCTAPYAGACPSLKHLLTGWGLSLGLLRPVLVLGDINTKSTA